MKLMVYGTEQSLGLLLDGHVVDLLAAGAQFLSEEEQARRPLEMAKAILGTHLTDFLNGGQRALEWASKVEKYARKRLAEDKKEWRDFNGDKLALEASSLKLHPPLSYFSKVMCTGQNFADHKIGMEGNTEKVGPTAEQVREKVRKGSPWGFYKQLGNFVGHGSAIPYPSRTQRLDYEGEVALIFGKRGIDLSPSQLMDYVFGYTLFNDLSIRDSHLDEDGVFNFALAKNFAGSGALGPCIVTKDELPDPQEINFTTTVNGQLRQKGNTKDMIRTFAELASFLSSDMVINPGDVLMSGTPSGTAADSSPRDAKGAQDPKLFLKVGDVVEVASAKIGVLRNTIVAKESGSF